MHTTAERAERTDGEFIDQRTGDEALVIAEAGMQLTVTDQPSYDLAAKSVKRIREIRKHIGEVYDPIQKRERETVKATREERRKYEDPLALAEKHARGEIARFDQEQERLRMEEQRKAEEEARKADEERRLQEAQAAEQNGAKPAVLNRILEQQSVTPVPKAAPTYQKASGVGTRENWSAEVTDMRALAEAVSKGKVSINALQANQTFLNQQARSMKDTLQIPGVRAVVTRGTTFR